MADSSHTIVKSKTGQPVLFAYDEYWPITDDLSIELSLYRRYLFGKQKNPEKAFFHMKKAHDLLWPEFAEKWSTWDEDCFKAHCVGKGDWVSYAGPGGTGKSHRAARLAVIFWLSAPLACKVAVTSTTAASAEGRCWGYVLKLLAEAKARHPWIKYRSTKNPGLIYWGNKSQMLHCMILAPVLKGEDARTLSTLAGMHPDQGYLFIVDEAEHMPQGLFEVFTNAKKGTPWFQAHSIANPGDKFSVHGIMSTPINGWDSIDPMKEGWWETRQGICLYLNPFQSPAILHPDPTVRAFYEEINFPTLLGMEQSKNDYGEQSVQYWSQCLGLWPPVGLEPVVLTPQLIEIHKVEASPEWHPGPKILIAGLDPAFAVDGDNCILQFAEVGYEVTGRWTMALEPPIYIKREVSEEDVFYQVARKVRYECERRQLNPQFLGVECHGTGMGFASILSRDWSEEFLRIEGVGGATEAYIDFKQQLKAKDAYKNRLTEMWFNVRRFVVNNQIKGLGKVASMQFTRRRFERDLRGKIELERKILYKQRLGKTGGMGAGSPDEADAVTVVAEVARIRLGWCCESPNVVGERIRNWGVNPFSFEDHVNFIKKWEATKPKGTLEQNYRPMSLVKQMPKRTYGAGSGIGAGGRYRQS